MKAETAEIAIVEKVHRATDSGRAICGTTRHGAEHAVQVTLHDKTVTCLKCLRMLHFVDRARVA
jgi:hypothetical protein